MNGSLHYIIVERRWVVVLGGTETSIASEHSPGSCV
ncbi:hypothetical protein T4A_10650 [Trichinella pseudospiralis]|uniref:Uncharacterized protein n=1 Tax=Trichinella pseudospiralis TaxID=6337 RepID=A0A0V1DLU5_TRIPS|nr:hypothetical protein T4A_10650 [Trichinella pseudospiralis]